MADRTRAPRFLRFAAIIAVAASTGTSAQSPSRPQPVFRSGTELVLVNVVVRDRSGAVVRGLTREDFSIAEDDKAHTISGLDCEELAPPQNADAAAEAAPSPAPPVLASPAPAAAAPAAAPPPKVDMHGRRLIVLFFDLSSMQPEELERAVSA